MAKTVVVTGRTGFIGGWAIVELLKRGYSVRTTVRSLDKEPMARARISAEVEPGDRLSFFAAISQAMQDGTPPSRIATMSSILLLRLASTLRATRTS